MKWVPSRMVRNQKIQRQPRKVVIVPPVTGPRLVATSVLWARGGAVC